MKIRALVQATPTGKVGDVFDDVEIAPDSGTACASTDFGWFRLKPHEFEIAPSMWYTAASARTTGGTVTWKAWAARRCQ